MIKVILPIIIIISIQESTSCQWSLLDTEKYYLDELLINADYNNMQELTEIDKNQVVMREWIFDDLGKLKEENDYRGMHVTSSIAGVENNVASTLKITYSYSYDSIGRILSVMKKLYSEEDTTNMKFSFQYIGTDTIIETLKASETIVYGDFVSEFNISAEICSLKVDAKIDFVISTWSYNGITTGTESIRHSYNDYGKLTKKAFTYDFGDKTDNNFNEKEANRESNIITYEYDPYNRLERVKRYENDKIIFNNTLKYDLKNSKLRKIESWHDESREPQEIIIELFYNENGFLQKVISNGNVFYYKIKTNKK